MLDRKGRILVLTGEGKGKTSSALGMVIRALGWGKKVCVLQFFKSPEYECGERIFLEKCGVEIHPLGIGFSWLKTEEEQRDAIRNGWAKTLEKLSSDYDMVVIDEIINVFSQKNVKIDDILTEEDLKNALEKYSVDKDIILTGRGCGEILKSVADTVTEMVNVKHGYEEGLEACKGIEY